MSDVVPSPHERELADQLISLEEPYDREAIALALARHREEILREFVELQLDCDAMGDVKLARALRELIDTARGVP